MKTTKVFRYGLLPPIENGDLVEEQLRRAHKYKNTLIEIEREWTATKKDKTPSAKKRKIKVGETGLFWGTYNRVTDSMKTSFSMRAANRHREKQKNRRRCTLPPFLSYTGEGLLAVQIQKGTNATSSFAILDAEDTRTGRRANQRKLLRFRIGSGEKKRGVFALFPMTMHRPMPEGGIVTNVTITRCRRGGRSIWEAHFSVMLPEPTTTSVTSKVAIDIGWRRTKNGGLRVLAWRGDDGASGFLELPPSFCARVRKSRDITSIRGKLFAAVKEELSREDRKTWPVTIRETSQMLVKWRAQKKLVRLYRLWQKEEPPPAYLVEWVKRDRHLMQYEVGCLQGALGNRNDIYRNFAATLARTYAYAIVERISLKDFAEYDENETRSDKAAPGQRFDVAHSVLRQALNNAFMSCGGQVIEVDPAGTTRECSACGYLNEKTRNLMITCVGCQQTYDRDSNATVNILARGSAEFEDLIALAKDTHKEKEMKALARKAQRAERRHPKKEAQSLHKGNEKLAQQLRS